MAERIQVLYPVEMALLHELVAPLPKKGAVVTSKEALLLASAIAAAHLGPGLWMRASDSMVAIVDWSGATLATVTLPNGSPEGGRSTILSDGMTPKVLIASQRSDRLPTDVPIEQALESCRMAHRVATNAALLPPLERHAQIARAAKQCGLSTEVFIRLSTYVTQLLG